jgi:hypothetical protein
MGVIARFCSLVPGLALIACAGCQALGSRDESYHPQIDPARFSARVDNRFYPLVPGTVLKYVETWKGETSENEITVTPDTKTIMGVTCVVVHDVVKKNGRIAEDTYDWLAQDDEGAVWYFGEDTKEISAGGLVSRQGSWEAGLNGAYPGILMPGKPSPGSPYRQEYGPGQAEDMGQVVALNETVSVPAGTFADTVKTKEWSLLEAGHENKWYAAGVGVVREVATDGTEARLVSITRP